jgi:ribosomal protein L3 glutamine methyltransferase
MQTATSKDRDRRDMARLSHTKAGRRPGSPAASKRKPAVLALVGRVRRRLQRARLHYGHGTDNPGDDAAALVWHALGLPLAPQARRLARAPTAAQLAKLESLVRRRVAERVPVVYLTRRSWFAGLPMYVDERVLIPRSPIAELVEASFQPWIDPARVRRIVDVGTGSGCIAIACALAFPRARVDALDLSTDALAVARINIRAHRLGRRVRALQSDHFSALAGGSCDIIVSNPPYVGRREMAGLPAEYRHEPAMALAAGSDGLDSVRVLLAEAVGRLRPGGLLVVEVGNSERAVRRAWPQLPFTWLEFARGGGGVFLLTREQLLAATRKPGAGTQG